MSFYADESPLFVVSGRVMSTRADMVTRCPQMVAQIPPGARRPVLSESIHVLGPDAAYSVTQFALGPPNGERSPMIVAMVETGTLMRAS